jgi:hypothetical protein
VGIAVVYFADGDTNNHAARPLSLNERRRQAPRRSERAEELHHVPGLD